MDNYRFESSRFWGVGGGEQSYREREMFHPLVHTPMAEAVETRPCGSQEPELYPGLKCGWQGSKYLVHLLSLSLACNQGVGSEVE